MPGPPDRPRRDPWLLLSPRARVLARDARISLDRVLGPLVRTSDGPVAQAWWRSLPGWPRALRRTAEPGVWPALRLDTPDALRTYPGVRRDPAAQDRAYAEQPLHEYFKTHHENMPRASAHAWHFILPASPRLARAGRRVAGLRGATPQTAAADRRRPDSGSARSASPDTTRATRTPNTRAVTTRAR
jgi:hypothetical protein